MSRVEALDLAALRARLILAIEGDELPGSVYLHTIAALLLACDPASPGELGMLDSIYRQQAQAEAVEADPLLDLIASVTRVLS